MKDLDHRRGARQLRRVALDLEIGLVGARLCQVVVGLHLQPGVRRPAEDLLKADGHVGADAGLLVDDVIQGLAADAKDLGCTLDGQMQRRKAIVFDDAAGMELDSS